MSTPAESLESLPARTDDGCWLAVIEATRGSLHKLKYRSEWRAFVLDGVLPLGLSFPCDFGFVPSTLGADGDPLDVLVFADEALPVGAVVPCRLVGLLEATQRDPGSRRAVRNDRLLAVAAKSHRHADWHDLRDLPATVLDDIERFFVVYNEGKGGRFVPLARRGAAAAAKVVAQGTRGSAGDHRAA